MFPPILQYTKQISGTIKEEFLSNLKWLLMTQVIEGYSQSDPHYEKLETNKHAETGK